jgi:excisionase family DNA binding protein
MTAISEPEFLYECFRDVRRFASSKVPLEDPALHVVEVESQMASKATIVLNQDIGRRLLNVRETAQYLGLEVDTVYKKARLRELPCVKVGRALRFDLKALERFIEQHTIETID